MGNPFEDLRNDLNNTLLEVKSELVKVNITLQKIRANKYYSVQDISAATGNCDQTIRKLFKTGEIKGIRLGRKYMVTQDEFDRICSNVKTLNYKRN